MKSTSRSNKTKIMSESFDTIRARCLRDGVLFEDDDFPANDSSLFFSKAPNREFQWKRPTEICEDPQLYVGGATQLDIFQGYLGNSWFLAAVASLATRSALLSRVVPEYQSFKKGEYAGVFHFQFWQFGRWVDVVVDDRLPTYNNELIFVHSKERNEFWSALLEKAYAKLNGSYEALKGGRIGEAMEDLTGGVVETYNLSKAPEDLYKTMQKAFQLQSLLGCIIDAVPDKLEEKLSNGLVTGHAYTVTGCHTISVGSIPLVRVRNPWGQREWEGDWSDGSAKWRTISDSEKREMGIDIKVDGEFWMTFEDFSTNFSKLEICSLSPEATATESKAWKAELHEGKWRKGSSAGGSRNNPDTFHTNPQIPFTLEDVNEDDAKDNCAVIIALMQKDRRILKSKGGVNLTIGFAIYKLEENETPPMDRDYFLYHASTARSPTFVNSREVTGRYSLAPGRYIIVPSTFVANENGEFIVRLYTEAAPRKDAELSEGKPSEVNVARVRPTVTEEESKQMDSKFKALFDKLAGEDEEIDAFELQKILIPMLKNEMGVLDIEVETCRCLMSSVGTSDTGMLDYSRFKNLWVLLKNWMGIYRKCNRDRSGSLDHYELRSALEEAGFKLSNTIIDKLGRRFSNKAKQINISEFLLIVARLDSMYNLFQSRTKNQAAKISLGLDDWLSTTVLI